MGWGRERGPRVIDFFTKNPNLKKKEKKGGGAGGGWGWGRGAWLGRARQTGPNQFAPSTSSKLGALECINVQVISLTSSMYDHVII